jgi:competence protein ComEC
LYILSISLLFLLFIFNSLYRSFKVYHYKTIIAGLFFLLWFLLGGLCSVSHQELKDPQHFAHHPAKYLKVYIADEPQNRGGILRFKARVICSYRGKKKTRSLGGLLVSVYPKSVNPPLLNYAGVYLIPARYTSIPSPLNPAEFDNRFWLANQNIYHQVSLSADELIPLNEYRGLPLIRFAVSLRKRQVEQYRKLIRDDEAFAVAATLILGYRTELDTETVSAYSKTGTIHALSVSGMHVGIVYLVLNRILRRMDRKTTLKWAKVIIMLTLIWFYTLLTGYSASVLRSAIMLTMLILTRSLHKNTGSYHILVFSAFCLLFYDPFLLWDAGFQLSYMAVYGLVYLQPKIHQLLSFKYWWAREIWSIISLSLSAQVFTFPFSIYYFHQFPVYFLLSNLFITLPVVVLMYVGLAILIFRLSCLAVPFEWLITFMNHGLERIARLPYSTINQIWITKPELILLCLLLVFTLRGLCDSKKQSVFAALFLLILLQGILSGKKIKAAKQKSIVLFSLKKNYAVAFLSCEKAVVVTGLSPGDKAFKFYIQPALDRQRISSIVCIPWNKVGRKGLHGLIVKEHQVRFHQFTILMADSFFNRRRIKDKPSFDAIWIHGNPEIEISAWRKDIRFRKIWIDATNTNDVTNKIATDTLYFRNSTIVLKKIKASLINLHKYKPIKK